MEQIIIFQVVINLSKIFTGEDPSVVKESRKRIVKTKISNVIFNDYYFERHPNIKQVRKQRYLVEDKIRKESGYIDDLKKSKQTEAYKRKIKDSYLNNPMKIYNNFFSKEQSNFSNNSFT